jgi:RNA polymerase sigma factor for flagellar operon FliA
MHEAVTYEYSNREDGESLAQDYLYLVKKIGLHLAARLPAHIQLDDLMQVGMIGLLQARDGYDPARGASFATYAGIRIKGAMLDEVRREDWVPRSTQQKMKRVSEAIKQVEARLARSVTDVEIAEELDVSLEEYHRLSAELVSCRMISLDDSDAGEVTDSINPFSQIEDSELRQMLAASVAALPEQESFMMSLYYGDELNLKEIGEVLGVSESRVSQIHGQALARLRNRIAHQRMNDYDE